MGPPADETLGSLLKNPRTNVSSDLPWALPIRHVEPMNWALSCPLPLPRTYVQSLVVPS